MREIVVRTSAPVRLDKYLQGQFPALGMGLLNKALRQNKIKLNGKKQPLSTRVSGGDVIRLFLTEEQLTPTTQGPAFLQARKELQIVYEDDYILIVEKPAGLPTLGEAADTLEKRVLRVLYEAGRWAPGQNTPRLCHRLDTGTSGLVVLAKTEAAETAVLALQGQHLLEKKYLCVTFGRPSPPQALLQGYLRKDAQKGIVYISENAAPGAVPIRTQYCTRAVSGRLALLEVTLLTGRTHQIRAHLASIGCPILGDSKYGNNTANRELRCRYQALCAYSLRFPAEAPAPELAGVRGRTFHARQPWYYAQLLDGTLK